MSRAVSPLGALAELNQYRLVQEVFLWLHLTTLHYCGGAASPLITIEITLRTTATMPRIWLARSWLVKPR